MLLDDTIAAIASPAGGAARGIVRVSGPNVVQLIAVLFQSDEPLPTSPPGRVKGFVPLDESGRRLPCDLYLWPSSRSYTRQPLAEFHTLGSPPLLHRLLEVVCRRGARLARPGEFTLRAFLSGRLDLTQAEGVLGVIDAADRRQLDVALSQLAGGLARPLAELRSRLLDLLAQLEAGLDFVEEDIEFISRTDLAAALDDVAAAVERIREQVARREVSGEAPRVALLGPPNAGKSSLFNALIGREAALVADLPGTTRDYVSATIPFDGLECELIDTAGVEPAAQLASIAAAAQRATAAQREQAALALVCIASDAPESSHEELLASLDGGAARLIVRTKCDLGNAATVEDRDGEESLPVSSRTGAGLAQLRQAIAARLAALQTAEGAAVAATAVRCRESLRLAADHLAAARELAALDRGAEELIAAEIRGALLELGQVAGVVYTDDLLDRIFSRFCIGK